jgi:hypothetical protein
MWTYLIIMPSPLLYQHLSFSQWSKDLPVQQFILELTVKRFNVPVLLRAARLNIESLDP